MSHWVEGLNSEQTEAVLATDGPLLILAGAGSGKTTVLVSRTGRLVDELKVPSHRICVLTFTNKAARELKHRVGHKLGPAFGKAIQALTTGTFHSFGLKWLKANTKAANLPMGFGIIDGSDSEGILREMTKTTISQSKDSFRLDRLLERMNQLREHAVVRMLNPKCSPCSLPGAELDAEYEEMARALLPKYLERLRQLGVVDFTALIERPLEAIISSDSLRKEFQTQFDYLMVDEFQDTNRLQLEFVRELSKGTGCIAVVGDDDQAIYGWRGAEVANILNFPKEFSGARVVRLEQNYRSSPAILSLANAVISKNEKRHGKILRNGRKVAPSECELPELFEYETEEVEAEQTALRISEFLNNGVPHREIAVLYRSNSQGSLIEAELRRNQIPYQITGGQAFFDRREVKDVLAFLRCAVYPNELGLRRLFVTPPRGLGEVSIQKIETAALSEKKKFVECARLMAAGGVITDKMRPKDELGSTRRDLKVSEALKTLFDELTLLREGLLVRNGLIEGQSPGERLLTFLKNNGYFDFVRSLHKGTESFQSHWFVVETFAKVMDSYLAREENGNLDGSSLLRFIDRMELRDSDQGDERAGQDGEEPIGKVQLLTLHACKGLEFDAVCLVGCEEDLLPHRTLGLDISEERRLFYVGVTRARKFLVLSRARARKKYGRMQPSAPSRFLLEIPEGFLTRFAEGVRPLAKAQRRARIDELFKKMDHRVASLVSKDEVKL